jgi:hypothetical protein
MISASRASQSGSGGFQFVFRPLKFDLRRVPIGRRELRKRTRAEDFDQALVRQVDQTAIPEVRESAAHRFDCQSEVVGNVLALHCQIDHTGAGAGGTGRKHGQEPSEPLVRGTVNRPGFAGGSSS